MAIRKFLFMLVFGAAFVFALPVSAADNPAPVTAPAPSVSVFFTPDEVKAINALAGKRVDSGHADISLGALMYYAPDDWTLWLQGERWTPSTQRADLRVLEVKPDEVRLSFLASPGASPQEITLKPNQTYRVATDSVVEGGP